MMKFFGSVLISLFVIPDLIRNLFIMKKILNLPAAGKFNSELHV